MKIYSAIFTLFFVFLFDAKSDTFNLYNTSHPITGKSGSLLGTTSVRHCLAASFRANDGEQRLDTFNLSSGIPQYTGTISFGNLLEDQTNLIPNAQLKAPRDLAVIGSHLIWWSYYKVHAGNFDQTCNLINVKSFDFNNSLNTVFNRFDTSAQIASKRNVLTDQEIIDLITSGATNEEVSDASYKTGFYDFSQPDNPFFASFAPQLGVLGDGSTERFLLNINGNSTIGTLKNKNSLDISVFTPDLKSTHLQTFFGNRITQIYNTSNLGKSLLDIKNQAIGTDFQKQLFNELILTYLFEISGIAPSTSLSASLKLITPENSKVINFLKKLQLNENATVRQSVRGLVAEALKNYDLTTNKQKFKLRLSQELASALFNTPNNSLQTLRGSLLSAMQGEFNAQGLAAYLTNTIVSPLSGDLPLLKVTFGELLDSVTSNQFAGTIDAALSALDFALPDEVFTDLFLTSPGCLKIPNTSREFLNLALVTSGPKVDINGVAFFELLKVLNYYFENDDFNRLTSELNARISDLHEKISLELATELTRGINFSGDLSLSISDIFNQSLDLEISAISLTDPITEVILNHLGTLKIKSSLKIKKSLLQAAQFNPRLRKQKYSKNLSKKQEKALLKKLTVKKLITYITPKVPQPDLKTIISASIPNDLIKINNLSVMLDDIFNGLFGDISLDINLQDAASTFIRSKIDHNIIANFISETLGEALASMSSNGGGIPIAVKKIWRAAHGDCLAEWQIAFDTAAGLAKLANLDPIAIEFKTTEEFLGIALDQSIKFVVQQTLSNLLDGIFTKAKGSYPQWELNLKKSDYNFSLASLSGVSTKLSSVFSYKNKIVSIQRNNGVSLPDINSSDEVIATIFSLNGNKNVVSLGDWETLSVSGGNSGLILISGNKSSTDTSLLLDFRDGTLKIKDVTSLIPFDFRRPDRIFVPFGELIALYSELNGLFLIK